MPPITLFIPLVSGLALLGLGYFALRDPQKAMEIIKSKYRENDDLKQFKYSASVVLFLGCLLILLSVFGYAVLIGIPTGQTDNMFTSAPFRSLIQRLLSFALFVVGALKLHQVLVATRIKRISLKRDWYLKAQSPTLFRFIAFLHLTIAVVFFLGAIKLWRA
jgi:hypothetical protein